MRLRPEKTLAVQFKYFGDAVFMTPALRALREHRPEGELHVLVASEVAPLLEHLPWITKVWPLPRTRGRARFLQSWPVVCGLRREHFDWAVDFGGNDRGAIMSFLSGGRRRLGTLDRGTKWFKRFCYTEVVLTDTLPRPWVSRHLQLLSAWNINAPQSLRIEIAADPDLAAEAAKTLPNGMVICHLGTSQPRKEWPLRRWQEFFRLATAAGFKLAFSAGPNERERSLLADLKQREPDIFAVPVLSNLKEFLAVLRRARAVIAGDTGPLHFASGLGVPVVGLFGTGASVLRAAPSYRACQVVKGGDCLCEARFKQSAICHDVPPCMAAIKPEQVLAALRSNVAPDEQKMTSPRSSNAVTPQDHQNHG
jgi:ADP-heptose:LPS heptosyltransferase